MSALNDHVSQWRPVEDDPLVDRLRGLEWAEVPPEIRERCWESISTRIGELQAREETEREQALARQACDAGERYSFSRRPATLRPSVAEGWSRPTFGRAAMSFS